MMEDTLVEVHFNIKDNKKKSEKNMFFIDGGGTKGVYAIGVIKYLFDENPYLDLTNVNIFGGTSVGSYIATALSFGYTSEDIVSVAEIIDLSKLIDNKYLFMVTACRFMMYGYLYNNDGRMDIITKILSYKLNNIKNHLGITDNNFKPNDLTFAHLKKLINLYPAIYKDLIVNTVDISRGQQVFPTTLNDKWNDIKIVDALMASSAIPIVFDHSTLYYYPETDRYGYAKTNASLQSFFVDGGMATNNPMDYFLYNYDQYTDYKMWILKFDNLPPYVKIDGLFDYLNQIINYFISSKHDVKRDLLENMYQINSINLHVKNSVMKIYTHKQVTDIIDQIYQKCVDGQLHFN